jgi:hypothetical protein
MDKRKAELRKIVLDIVLGREAVTYERWQFAHLAAGVAEVLSRRNSAEVFTASGVLQEPRFEETDWRLVQEIFWDLICERVITPGFDSSNSELPFFRLHSEARSRTE